MTDSYRQEVFNVLLAQLLQERGVIAAPENILRAGPERRRKMPDVIAHYQGLRLIIEGEVSDQPDAHDRALASAQRRVEEGLVHIGVAVVYPEALRAVSFDRLKDTLAESVLDVAVFTEAGETGYTSGSIDHLETVLRRAFSELLEEDVVAEAVAVLDDAVEKFTSAIMVYPKVAVRYAAALGIQELPVRRISTGSDDEDQEKLAGSSELSWEQRAAVSRITALVLTNAMIFRTCFARITTRCARRRRSSNCPPQNSNLPTNGNISSTGLTTIPSLPLR